MKKAVLTYILTFLFCISFILGLIGLHYQSHAFDANEYIKRLDDHDYSKIVLESIYQRFEGFGDAITLSADDIYPLLHEESAVEYSKNYTKTYLSAVLNGKEFSSSNLEKYDFSYAKDDLKKLVENFYETSEHEFSDEEFSIIFNYIETEINNAMKFLPSKILNKTASYGNYAVKAQKILGIFKIALIPAIILLGAIIYMNLKNGIGKMLRSAGSAFFFPSAILFIPFYLFKNYNLGSKVVIMRSPLSAFVSTTIDVLVKDFTFITGIIFVLSLLAVVVGTIIMVRKIGSKKEKTYDSEGKGVC